MSRSKYYVLLRSERIWYGPIYPFGGRIKLYWHGALRFDMCMHQVDACIDRGYGLDIGVARHPIRKGERE